MCKNTRLFSRRLQCDLNGHRKIDLECPVSSLEMTFLYFLAIIIVSVKISIQNEFYFDEGGSSNLRYSKMSVKNGNQDRAPKCTAFHSSLGSMQRNVLRTMRILLGCSSCGIKRNKRNR